MIVTSVDNDRIKEVVHLRDRHWRDKLNLFLIEGYRELLRALDGKAPLVRLFICPELF